MLTLAHLFRRLDELLKIDSLPVIKVLIPATLIYVLFFAILFKLLGRNTPVLGAIKNTWTHNNKVKRTDLALFLFLLGTMIYSLASIISSMGLGITPMNYVIVSLLTPPIIFILTYRRVSSFLLLFILVVFGITFVPIQVNIINGINVQETLSDTINIFANAHWRFSYHNPVYDALPYDSTLTVILMHMFNIEEPANALIKALMETCIVVFIILAIIILAFNLGFSFRTGVLDALFMLSLPYLAFWIPPTNFSIAFMMLFITILIRSLTKGHRTSDLIVIVISLIAGILAHQMSVLILSIPLFILLTNTVIEEKNKTRLLSIVIILGLIVYLLYLTYTEALEVAYGYLRIYTTSLERLGYIEGRQSSFEATVPRTVDALYPLPIALVVAFLLNLFIEIVSRKNNKNVIMHYLKNKQHQFLIAIYVGIIIWGLIAGVSLATPHTFTRHFGVLLYLFVGLGTMPIFTILLNDIPKKRTLRILVVKKVLIVCIILTIIGGLLTPHNLPSHYSWVQSPLPRDYALSEFLVSKGLLSGNITFVLRTEKIYTGTSGALWAAWLKHVMIKGWNLPRYYTSQVRAITYHINSINIEDYKRLIFDSSKIYSSYYRNVYIR